MGLSLSVLENKNFASLGSTNALPVNPSGTLPAVSSQGSEWITVLTEPFNAFFRSRENQAIMDYNLQSARQEQTTRLSLEGIRTKTALGIATALVFGAILFGVFKGS